MNPRRVPFVRLGLLLVVGSVFASLLRWYTALAADAADLNSKAPTERRDIFDHFLNHFLFQGTTATVLFWLGIAVILLGTAALVFGRPVSR
jgi:hypothetical protein